MTNIVLLVTAFWLGFAGGTPSIEKLIHADALKAKINPDELDVPVDEYHNFAIDGTAIGSGQFGSVFKAREKLTQKTYALKDIVLRDPNDMSETEQILLEARLMYMIRCPFTVQLKSVIQEEYYEKNRLTLVLEYVPNGNLEELQWTLWNKEKRFFNEDEARYYAVQLILALKYLYDVEIAHRDFKPDNVFLDTNLNVKIGDFGQAKPAALCKEGETPGIGFYGSPETLAGHASGTKSLASDWWSLGVILYNLVTSQHPFLKTDEWASVEFYNKLNATKSFRKPEHNKMSPEFEDLLRRLLVIDPNSRWTGRNISQIIEHPWFRNVSWMAHYNQTSKMKSPFKKLFPHYKPDKAVIV